MEPLSSRSITLPARGGRERPVAYVDGDLRVARARRRVSRTREPEVPRGPVLFGRRESLASPGEGSSLSDGAPARRLLHCGAPGLVHRAWRDRSFFLRPRSFSSSRWFTFSTTMSVLSSTNGSQVLGGRLALGPEGAAAAPPWFTAPVRRGSPRADPDAPLLPHGRSSV